MNRLRFTAAVTAVAFGALACGSTGAQPVPGGDEGGGAASVDTRTQGFVDALHAAGVPEVDPTAIDVLPGICTRLAMGTPDAAILANLAPVADYLAAANPGSGDTDSVARTFLTSARDVYC